MGEAKSRNLPAVNAGVPHSRAAAMTLCRQRARCATWRNWKENSGDNTRSLNAQFAIPEQQLPRKIIAGDRRGNQQPQATASLCLQGAPDGLAAGGAVPVLAVARRQTGGGQSIRGGVPVCWPWFGAHASEPGFPAHGYARTVPRQVVGSALSRMAHA
jgi:hypothetical protein